jgi:type II secretory ATPase GspE/PulE/Tfp pilus assembly ATPase PilB-like protein
VTEDTLLETLCHKQIIRKQDILPKMRNLPCPPDAPIALIWVLSLSQEAGALATKQILSILGEKIAVDEARDNNVINYIPCPGYLDAKLILPFEKYKDIPPQHQRETAFILNHPGIQTLLLLKTDPWDKTPWDETTRFWTQKANELNFVQPEIPLKPLHGLTQLADALSHTRRKHWEISEVNPTTRANLEAHLLNPYWETPTHVYAWDTNPEPNPRKLARVENLIFKQLRTLPPIYDHHGTLRKLPPQPRPNQNEYTAIWQKSLVTWVNEQHSDIHILPNIDGALAVATRLHGRIRPRYMIPVSKRDNFYHAAMLGTGLDAIKDPHMPKDARASFHPPEIGRSIDFRYSLHPGPPPYFWPQIIIRILDPQSLRPDVFAIGNTDTDKKAWEHVIATNEGSIIVCGPTGSGKSMTLYSLLNTWHTTDPGLKFQTIEDPIEFLLGPWLHQSEVLHQQDVPWERLIRQSLRNDIDGLMIGEIRDRKTAKLANQFSISGHILLSSLHTPSALLVPSRLKEMGANPATTAHTLKVAISQRLAGLSCPKCQRPLSDLEKQTCLNHKAPKSIIENLVNNSGCPHCRHEGINGRTAILEFAFFETTEEKECIRNPDPKKLETLMRQRGLGSLTENTWELAAKQKIPASEALNIASAA